jgi:type I restriction enzyme S subunit
MFYKETEFKDTPIGKIPKDWGIKKFEEVFKFKRGFSYRKEQITNIKTKTKFYTIDYIEKGGGKKRNFEEVYIKDDVCIDKDFFLSDGDLLIANTDMTKGDIIGAPILVECKDKNEKCVYSMDLTRLDFDKSKIYNLYVFYYLQTSSIRVRMKSASQGTNVLHLNHRLVGNFLISLPPLQEQQKIAEILYTIDKAIEKTNQIIEKTERIKKALMNLLLTGKIRVEERDGKIVFRKETEFKDTRGGF